MTRRDRSFRAMGARIRLIVETPGADAGDAERAITDAERFIRDFDRRLSRFNPQSELSALNGDPREIVPASALLRDAVRAGIRAAERTAGLVDPTLVAELEAAGYADSREGSTPARLVDALAFAGPRRPATPRPDARWREFEVDEGFGVIRRPAGARFDTGGTGKGLAADLVAECLGGHGRFVVDCGGDLRVGGTSPAAPIDVMVEHPLTGAHEFGLAITSGAVATSGLNVRVWRRPDGRFAHHLLDPATGEPAWTGLIGATAIAATAVEAETLAKAAVLSGPEGARRVLAANGGVLVHDSGETEVVGPAPARPLYSITVPGHFAVMGVAA